jgi:hypothetical protein
MSGSDYYAQAIQRALGLLRQGHVRQATNLLQDAIELKLDMLPSDMVEAESIELAFDPHAAAAPTCWIESQSNELFIDEEGWEIDPQFLDAFYQSVSNNVVLGMAMGDIERHANLLLEDGVKTGKVKVR